jgi:hypothetical protein
VRIKARGTSLRQKRRRSIGDSSIDNSSWKCYKEKHQGDTAAGQESEIQRSNLLVVMEETSAVYILIWYLEKAKI